MQQYYKTINIRTAVRSADTSILVIYTGGTIGMDYDATGKHLVPFDMSKIVDKVPELRRFDFELSFLSFITPLDSSDILPTHWLNLARIIENFYTQYDAFVILHGTDTMAYSASALSFLLKNLAKPVIFTGSQLPMAMRRTDARENLIGALEIASTKRNGKALIPEVCIYFDNLLLRGNRSRKAQSTNFTAFKSANFPPLAIAGVNIQYNENLILPMPQEKLQIGEKMASNVFLVKIFPGMSIAYLDCILQMPQLQGVVLQTYGSGNAPSDEAFIRILRNAIGKGIFIYNVTQCNGGMVKQGLYGTSRALAEIGVLSGTDITPEAAITKMMFLLANEQKKLRINQLMSCSMCGEMTNIDS